MWLELCSLLGPHCSSTVPWSCWPGFALEVQVSSSSCLLAQTNTDTYLLTMWTVSSHLPWSLCYIFYELLIYCFLQEQWRHWLTDCQMEAGLSWFHALITLLNCLFMFLWAGCPEATLSPGGLLSFMCSSTSCWQHSSAMNITSENLTHTQGIARRLSLLYCDLQYSCHYLMFPFVHSLLEKE